MTGDKTTRRVYSAEELHRLRVSCSQPKLCEAIEERDGDDAELVKEHVLRGTKSFTVRSFRSRTSGNSLRVPSNKENRSTADAENSTHSSLGHDLPFIGPVLGEIFANGQVLRSGIYKVRPSPTPSLKKKKAEAIVKAHGSPQHVRVTAGGRIVPSEQSPLCHPRYGYSAIKTNGGLIKFAPNHPLGKTQWTQATQNGFVAQDVNGRLCQIVNGTILPLNEVDGALRLYIPAPNLNITGSRGPSFAGGPSRLANPSNQQPRTSSLSKPIAMPDPPLPTQTNALELEYSKLEHELKELDKTEVLHGRTMGKAAKEALVAKRRELIVTLDNIRRAIKSIKSMPFPDDLADAGSPVSDRRSMSPPRTRLPMFLQHQQRARHPAFDGDGATMPPPPSSGPFFGFSQAMPFNSNHYGFTQHTTPPDVVYDSTIFGMQPQQQQQALFIPSGFEDSMAPPFVPYADQAAPNAMPPSAPLVVDGSNPTHSAQQHLPQTDGAASFTDLQKVRSPTRSHAVDIKPPAEAKHTSALKSSLNPMSPAYKPGGGLLQRNTANTENQLYHHPHYPSTGANSKPRIHTPPTLSPLRTLKPLAEGGLGRNATDETISPTKKMPSPAAGEQHHLHSSSVSSFETADFFPRDTREYSVRRYAYPADHQKEGGKENASPPVLSPMADHASNPPTAAPPSTPAAGVVGRGSGMKDATQICLPLSSTSRAENAEEVESRGLEVPDRQTHNLSPKARRPPIHLPDAQDDEGYLSPHLRQPFQQAQPAPTTPGLKNLHTAAAEELHLHLPPLPDTPYPTTTTSGAPQRSSSNPASPGAETYTSCRSSPSPKHPPTAAAANQIDYSSASITWIEGYRAGLNRHPVEADRSGEFLDGYCAGLIKSKPTSAPTAIPAGTAASAAPTIPAAPVELAAPSTGSPVKVPSRRPSPAVLQSRSSTRLQQLALLAETSTTLQQQQQQRMQPFETKMHSMDTLKEAILAPANESAILSPTAGGPHVSEAPLDLGAWARKREVATDAGEGFSGVGKMRQGIMSEDDAVFTMRKKDEDAAVSHQLGRLGFASEDFASTHQQQQTASRTAELCAAEQHLPQLPVSRTTTAKTAQASPSSHRITSLPTIEANLYTQWPGARVFSNQLEWKSASSIAQATGLAGGYVGHVRPPPQQQRQGGDAPAKPQAPPSIPTMTQDNAAMATHSRFQEAEDAQSSLDGLSNPPNSPQSRASQHTPSPMSPPLPPTSMTSPTHPSKKGKHAASPGRKHHAARSSSSSSPLKTLGISPTKAKFESMVEKVGIKVSSSAPGVVGDPGTTKHGSPPGKRGWRDVWRGSGGVAGRKD